VLAWAPRRTFVTGHSPSVVPGAPPCLERSSLRLLKSHGLQLLLRGGRRSLRLGWTLPRPRRPLLRGGGRRSLSLYSSSWRVVEQPLCGRPSPRAPQRHVACPWSSAAATPNATSSIVVRRPSPTLRSAGWPAPRGEKSDKERLRARPAAVPASRNRPAVETQESASPAAADLGDHVGLDRAGTRARRSHEPDAALDRRGSAHGSTTVGPRFTLS